MKILILGSAIVDIVMEISSLPKKGEDIYCKNNKKYIGGCAFNVANILKSLNGSYDLFVPIGKGMYASLIKKEFKEKGHKIFIKDSSKDNGYCIAFLEEDGERTFITYAGIEHEFKSKWLDKIKLKKYNNIYIDGYQMSSLSKEKILNFLKKSKEKNIFFAPGPMINEIDTKTMKEILKLSPIVHLNEQEALKFTQKKTLKQAIEYIHNKTKNIVFITMNKKGVIFINENKITKVISKYKVKAIDTTGAGDAHIATIIFALSNNKTIEFACELANKVASKLVTIKGPSINDKKFFKRIKI